MTVPSIDDATRRQIAAAQPDRSTWLSANAGSGKTRVLTDRVARLLLGGTAPQNILCLTYTKAAASEMQNRLFKTLGGWSMLPDADLRAALQRLTGGGTVTDDALSAARRLFAKAVETPGGLRIQTIHSFCAILLRRFPVEAGVSPQFAEMDDRSAELLRGDCLEDLAERQPDTVRALARALGGSDIGSTVAALVAQRDHFRAPLDRPELCRLFEIPETLTEDRLVSQVFDPGTADLIDRVVTAMAASDKPTDQGNADKLRAAGTGTLAACEALESVLLTGASAKEPFSAKIGSIPTAGCRKAMDPADVDALNDLMTRVESAREARMGLAEVARNLALQDFAAAFLPLYERAKTARGWLDFDDLILRARDLLTRSDVARWVLYRLDGGIDHILVDEAQDTSPAQWQMIEALAGEITAGDGTEEATRRTLFVVGDKKQSIYSFQGADPEGFDRMHDRFSAQLGDGRMDRRDMLHSFRSAPAILRAVDAVFDGQGMEHIAFRDQLPGRVDLWPAVPKPDTDPPTDFDDPLDRVSPRDERAILAGHVADAIAAMIGTETIPDPGRDGERRKVQAGDVLILFRSRGPLFDLTIRACKARGIPVAGADRLTLMAELAVKDIAALLSFLATPEDDLSLAAALRSPLFGWSEQDLFTLAAHRGSRILWHALRDGRDAYPETMAIIDDLRRQADFLRPFELIDRILTRHGGRARLVGRLGPECEEAIDALLSQALGYERSEIPSLTGFLSWLTSDDIAIKRQSESAGGNLRIMSVHGAKGLEAPIVILPDTTGQPRNIDDPLWPVPDGTGRLLKQGKDARPPVLKDAHATLDQAAAAERDRLLYVAMTRAQFWLILCGAGDAEKTDGRWYPQLAAGLGRLDTAPLDTPAGDGLRFATGDWTGLTEVQHATRDPQTPQHDLPGWIDTPAGPPPAAPALLRPSDLGGAKVLPGEVPADALDSDAARARGTDLHLLLEYLPQVSRADWDRVAAALLPDLGEAERDDRLAAARTVIDAPGLADLFAPDALTEVPIAGRLPDGRALTGAIDRLLVTADRVLAVDYKSNAQVPDTPDTVPEGLLRQMGAYDAALAAIYPGRRIETALLWTATARLMPLPPELVRTAFARAGQS